MTTEQAVRRRPRDLRRAEEDRADRVRARTATRVARVGDAAWASPTSRRAGTLARGARRRASSPSTATASRRCRRASRREGRFDGEPLLVRLEWQHKHTGVVAAWTASSRCASRRSTRWRTCRCAGSCACEYEEGTTQSNGKRAAQRPGRVAAARSSTSATTTRARAGSKFPRSALSRPAPPSDTTARGCRPMAHTIVRGLVSLVLLACSAVAQPAQALTAYGVTASGLFMVRFDTATPGTLDDVVAFTGLQSGERIAGIDFRPRTGQLYGLGVQPGGGNDTIRAYVIDPATGAAEVVTSAPFTVLSATGYGMAFNPRVDRIRVVNNDVDDNFRINPNNGARADSPVNDTNLAVGTVAAVAYDRSFDSAPGVPTTVYAIEAAGNLCTIGGVDGTPSPDAGPAPELPRARIRRERRLRLRHRRRRSGLRGAELRRLERPLLGEPRDRHRHARRIDRRREPRDRRARARAADGDRGRRRGGQRAARPPARRRDRGRPPRPVPRVRRADPARRAGRARRPDGRRRARPRGRAGQGRRRGDPHLGRGGRGRPRRRRRVRARLQGWGHRRGGRRRRGRARGRDRRARAAAAVPTSPSSPATG